MPPCVTSTLRERPIKNGEGKRERRRVRDREREREGGGQEGCENERASQTRTLNEKKSLCVSGVNCTSVFVTHNFYFITFTWFC